MTSYGSVAAPVPFRIDGVTQVLSTAKFVLQSWGFPNLPVAMSGALSDGFLL